MTHKHILWNGSASDVHLHGKRHALKVNITGRSIPENMFAGPHHLGDLGKRCKLPMQRGSGWTRWNLGDQTI